MYKNDLFDRWAGRYDPASSASLYPFDGYEKILSAARSLVIKPENSIILDVGTGPGALVKPLYDAGAKVHALDFSAKMLERARTAMPGAVLHCHDFSRGLPSSLSGVVFDYITAGYALHHLEDGAKVEFLSSLRPHIKKGGGIIVADVSFETASARQACRSAAGEGWDTGEYYMAFDEMRPGLSAAGFEVQYWQLSSCGGLLFLL